MSLATNLLFIGHRRLAVALAEIEALIQDATWFEAYRKAREFGELLAAQLHADEVFIHEKLADLGERWEFHWSPLHAKRLRLKDEHHRLSRAIESRNAAEAQARMAALARIEGVHGDVSTELARALSDPPSPGHPSQ